MQLTDSLGRNINYLRLSVTDRCNMRCFYCMPRDGVEKKPHGSVLSYEELLLIAETAVALGIEKIRVTGGEPLVRQGIVSFLARLAAVYEGTTADSWGLARLPPGNAEAQTRGIVAFRVPLSRVETKLKLSQNRDLEDRHRVITRLEASVDRADTCQVYRCESCCPCTGKSG